MVPAIRTQVDGLEDIASDEAGISFAGVEDITRQEFKDEADVNNLLRRFGVNQQLRQDPQYTDHDYTLDLQQAMSAIDAAKRANFNVPDELRHKYPNWRSVLNGAESGEYQRDLQNLAIVKANDSVKTEQEKALAAEKAAIARRERAERELKRDREDLSGPNGNT